MISRTTLGNRLFEATLLAILLAVSMYGYERVTFISRLMALPSEWMNVTTFHVDDAKEGQDPMVSFTRAVNRPMTGRYYVEVHRVNGGQICEGTGHALYTPSELTTVQMPLSRYLDSDCFLIPGVYYLSAAIVLRDDNGEPPKTVRFASNEFAVGAVTTPSN